MNPTTRRPCTLSPSRWLGKLPLRTFGAINEKDSNKFWLSVDEEGCRWWMRQPMGDFESVEFVEAGYAATAEGYFLRYWISPEELELGDMTTRNFGSAPSDEEN
ncbi:hypothetical protein MCOR02_003788 [Pyricularia oryzae]|nr:hypothetical protein MCOR02_003788 [Pyricularia oryzae]KAI6294529.1 hypothetical protein MCOR34_009706 [Pyricularia oryzae]KAI6459894.1 hypothetical protein MCOR17_006845 [Pyricularia oryzae]KAI6506857.1 hypothetical protein MCOR13_003192 [Pyricularia oryzae]KAI6582803.1 hypothetical protein MCOR04_005177 [Pyricularia oryzae]